MGSVVGSTFNIYQGETPDLVFNIVDDDGTAYDLTGGEAVMTYKSSGGAVVNKSCTISTTRAIASFAAADTDDMIGTYAFQLWCRNAVGKIVMTKTGYIKVSEAHDTAAVAP